MRTLATTLSFSVLLAASAGAAPAVGSHAVSASNPFSLIDPAIKELATESGPRFQDCIAALDYLRADLASTQRRLKARNHGKIPSDQAGLVALKIKRVGRQQKACIDQTKEIDEHFTMAMRSLAGVEPNNHPGIPARRDKIGHLRSAFTASVRKLKVEGPKAQTPDGGAGDE